MNDVEEMQMPIIIDGHDENDGNDANKTLTESSDSSSSSDEDIPDINQDEIFETPIIQKVKEKTNVSTKIEKPSIKDEISDFEEIGEIVDEYKNGDTRFDGKIYYNGRWKTQPQLDHLQRMRDKRWEGHVKAEKKARPIKPIEPIEPIEQTRFDEDMLEKVALMAVNAYKEQKKSKKKKDKKPTGSEPINIPVKEEPIKNHYDPIINDINSRFTAAELEYSDCFF